MEEYYSDRPILDPGEIASSDDGDYSFRVIEHIGEGRCCLVYSARSVRDGTKVALKVYKRGPNYDGAVQREQYILDTFQNPKHKIALCFAYFIYNGLHCQVMELLEYNIRQLIFRNDRQGLSPWLTQKCARDLLTSLAALHENCFVHADLKPANVMWSSYDGCFKLLDFGLTFHTEETDLHQIQSSGYKSPESAEWNKFKDDEKKKRKRKLQGTYSDLTTAAPAFSGGLNEITETTKVLAEPTAGEQDICLATRSEVKGHTQNVIIENDTANGNAHTIMDNSLKSHQDSCIENPSLTATSEAHSISPSCSSSLSSTSSGSRRKPPPKHRLSCVIPSSDAGSELDIYVRPPRQRKMEQHRDISTKPPDATSIMTTSEYQDIVIDNTNKWPSESSGIFTASSNCHTPTGSTSVAEVDICSPVPGDRAEKTKNACRRNEMTLSKKNEYIHGNCQHETTTSITSCSSLTTSGSTQSCCHSFTNTTPTTEGICYSCCDVDCSKRSYLNSETSSRTSLDPSLSSLNSSVSNTCSSVISPCTSQSCCCSSSKSKANSESSDPVDLSQEWRRGRSTKKDVSGRKCPRPVSTHAPKLEERKMRTSPMMPNEKADIWSFGCLLVEALTGRKMFSASDKMANVLRPLQLLEMRIGETECRYHATENKGDDKVDRHKFFSDAKNLIQSCLAEDPTDRISAKAALTHQFFSEHELLPTLKDMVLLPTNVLRLLNVFDDPKYKNEDDIKDLLTEVREEAEKFGRVTDIKSNGGHAYVEFQEASDCQRAVSGLTGTTYEDRPVMAVFYPICLWSQNILLL